MTSASAVQKPGQKRGIFWTVLGLGAIVAVLFAGVVLRSILATPDLTAALEERNAIYFETPRPVPDVALTNHLGEPFNTGNLNGQWHLINFGYTHCPDVCPTNMMDMAKAYESLRTEGLAERVQMWMITVDPARDTVEVLSKYVPFYNPEFIGLTGDVSQLRPLAQQLNTVFMTEGSGDAYTVAHSDNLAIINPRGDYVAILRPPHRPQQMSEVLSLLMQYAD